MKLRAKKSYNRFQGLPESQNMLNFASRPQKEPDIMKANDNHFPTAACLLLAASSLLGSSIAGRAEQPTPETDLEAGIAAYRNYDFEGARRHFAAFSRQRKKASEEAGARYDEFEHSLRTAEGFLERIEQITIIDSIAVDADKFFEIYRLPEASGKLLPPDSIPFADCREDATVAFTNENRDFMMWAQTDSSGYTRLAESILLTDGQWSRPVFSPEELSEGGDADFPFMMSDGTTLYYASDGDESIGGLDIFVATRDSSTGEYLQPRNIGMPYNSPYDDYMLAIDELNGIGWWATDRNLLEGKVTVYVFLVNDIRQNINNEDYDEVELIDIARIASFKDSQTDEEQTKKAEEALAVTAGMNRESKKRKIEFRLPASGGRLYTSYEALPDENARTKMRSYLKQQEEFDAYLTKLSDARRKYSSSPTKAMAAEIDRMEKESESHAKNLKESRNELYKALGETN